MQLAVKPAQEFIEDQAVLYLLGPSQLLCALVTRNLRTLLLLFLTASNFSEPPQMLPSVLHLGPNRVGLLWYTDLCSHHSPEPILSMFKTVHKPHWFHELNLTLRSVFAQLYSVPGCVTAMDSTLASFAPNSIPAFQMVCKKAAVEKFAILLVGPSHLCEPFKNEIYNTNSEQYEYQMSVHCCELVEEILRSTQTCHADFIAFLIDPSDGSSIESVERSISVLDPVYLCSRICLINCSCLSPLNMAVDPEQIHNLVDKFSILLMNGNIKNEADRKFLSKRILYLTSSVCGIKTGCPLIFDLPRTKIVE